MENQVNRSMRGVRPFFAFLGRYLTPFARVVFCLLPVFAILHLLAVISPDMADTINASVGNVFRFCLATLTGSLPFSLGEMLLIGAPFLVGIPVAYALVAKRNTASLPRTLISLLAVLALLYILFVPTLGCAYHATTLDKKLSLDRRPVSSEQLFSTAVILREEANALAEQVYSRHEGFTVMPYAFSEMNGKLLEAYDSLAAKHTFLQSMDTRLKPVGISEAMSYAHITGVYSYMTGEANINVDYPDFTIPFTAAHEMAHQRGIAREDEANFVAFLVCSASEDAYIRYAGYMSMLRYVGNALAGADYEAYARLWEGYSPVLRHENAAYSAFYKKYENSMLGEVTGSINDAYLQMQGTAGTKSYGMVVDLAVAYYRN